MNDNAKKNKEKKKTPRLLFALLYPCALWAAAPTPDRGGEHKPEASHPTTPPRPPAPTASKRPNTRAPLIAPKADSAFAVAGQFGLWSPLKKPTVQTFKNVNGNIGIRAPLPFAPKVQPFFQAGANGLVQDGAFSGYFGGGIQMAYEQFNVNGFLFLDVDKAARVRLSPGVRIVGDYFTASLQGYFGYFSKAATDEAGAPKLQGAHGLQLQGTGYLPSLPAFGLTGKLGFYFGGKATRWPLQDQMAIGGKNAAPFELIAHWNPIPLVSVYLSGVYNLIGPETANDKVIRGGVKAGIRFQFSGNKNGPNQMSRSTIAASVKRQILSNMPIDRAGSMVLTEVDPSTTKDSGQKQSVADYTLAFTKTPDGSKLPIAVEIQLKDKDRKNVTEGKVPIYTTFTGGTGTCTPAEPKTDEHGVVKISLSALQQNDNSIPIKVGFSSRKDVDPMLTLEYPPSAVVKATKLGFKNNTAPDVKKLPITFGIQLLDDAAKDVKSKDVCIYVKVQNGPAIIDPVVLKTDETGQVEGKITAYSTPDSQAPLNLVFSLTENGTPLLDFDCPAKEYTLQLSVEGGEGVKNINEVLFADKQVQYYCNFFKGRSAAPSTANQVKVTPPDAAKFTYKTSNTWDVEFLSEEPFTVDLMQHSDNSVLDTIPFPKREFLQLFAKKNALTDLHDTDKLATYDQMVTLSKSLGDVNWTAFFNTITEGKLWIKKEDSSDPDQGWVIDKNKTLVKNEAATSKLSSVYQLQKEKEDLKAKP